MTPFLHPPTSGGSLGPPSQQKPFLLSPREDDEKDMPSPKPQNLFCAFLKVISLPLGGVSLPLEGCLPSAHPARYFVVTIPALTPDLPSPRGAPRVN